MFEGGKNIVSGIIACITLAVVAAVHISALPLQAIIIIGALNGQALGIASAGFRYQGKGN
jgi:hypothetical protein